MTRGVPVLDPAVHLKGGDPGETGEGAVSPDGAATGPRSTARYWRRGRGRGGCDRRAGRRCPAFG